MFDEQVPNLQQHIRALVKQGVSIEEIATRFPHSVVVESQFFCGAQALRLGDTIYELP